MANVYSRTYASAIPGTPTHMEFNDTTRDFVLEFIWNGNMEPTVIRTSVEAHYPLGYVVNLGWDGRIVRRMVVKRDGNDKGIIVVRFDFAVEGLPQVGGKINISVSKTL
jgi:hypothetical protein